MIKYVRLANSTTMHATAQHSMHPYDNYYIYYNLEDWIQYEIISWLDIVWQTGAVVVVVLAAAAA